MQSGERLRVPRFIYSLAVISGLSASVAGYWGGEGVVEIVEL
jgi:hypothetical protein